jgi:hypothetical protein
MPSPGTAELTFQERGILATSAYAAYLDDFSSADRVLVSAYQQPVLVTRRAKPARPRLPVRKARAHSGGSAK